MANRKKKKTPKRKKREKVHHIDHIPKCSQQPRTPGGAKRRTDFSLFFCSSSSSLSNVTLPQGSLLESPSCRDILSSVTIASLDGKRDERKRVIELPLVECSHSHDKRHGLFSNCVEVPVVEVDSADQNVLSEPWIDRNVGKQTSKIVRTLEFTPIKSQIIERNDACRVPGSVVWAKRAHQLWWPAEILGERSTKTDSSYQGSDGDVLIQYYGNHESAWVDPARDLSQFEDCFDERSCNPLEEFQDALKQALNHMEYQTSCRQLIGSSDDGLDCSNQQDQSLEKVNSSSSSRTESDCQDRRRRGMRERKPKIHFDEGGFQLKSARKFRRFRIMRFLGLAAPVGSPF